MSQLITGIWQPQAMGKSQDVADTAKCHRDCGYLDLANVAVSSCPGWKRIMDVVGSSCGLIVASPLLILIALIIKCVSRGPVLFRQQRFGLGGQPFFVWKFRTMDTVEQSTQHQSYVLDLMTNNSTYQKRDRQLAVIPCGALIRRLGLDELPQLVNVLKGEMSLVGPRPDVVPLERYEPWQRDRFRAVPGITGLWQVSGKNQTTFATMIHLDIAYIHLRSLWFDLFILARTLPAILFN
jgi:lipopolysaccharide/colanic/teichoic acid biosynthesis glycosyltransferase